MHIIHGWKGIDSFFFFLFEWRHKRARHDNWLYYFVIYILFCIVIIIIIIIIILYEFLEKYRPNNVQFSACSYRHDLLYELPHMYL